MALIIMLCVTAGARLSGQTITAAIDRQLLDLIDQHAPSYFNAAWGLNLNQFKAWLATIAWAEGYLGGYGAHSQTGGGYNGDAFNHIAVTGFRFSTGLGPFQLDRGSTENWHLWTSIAKLDPQQAVVSVARWHRDNRGAGSTLSTFANASPWVAVRNPSSFWTAVTGTSWASQRGGNTPLDWATIKNQLAANALYYSHLPYSMNIVNKGPLRWNITSSANIRTDSGRAVVFDSYYTTYLITARGPAGSQVCKYYYAYRTDLGPYPIEVWAWADDTRYIFARECNGPFPEARVSGTAKAGYPALASPAVQVGGDTTPPTVTLISPRSGTFTVGSQVMLSATASDESGISQCQYWLVKGGNLVGSSPIYGNNPGQGMINSYVWTIPATFNGYTINGTDYQIFVVVWDASANRNMAGDLSSYITLQPPDTTPPTVTISSPTSGQTFSSSPITVSGTASDPGSPSSGVASVQVRVNGGSWQTASGTTSWSASVALVSGSNLIEARSRDNAGNYSSIASVSVTFVMSVPNDQCADAIALTNAVPHSMNTDGATSTEAPPTCGSPFGKGVWYKFTPQASGQVIVSTCGSDFDTVLEVYTGGCGALMPLAGACNDDEGPACPGLQASTSFAATAGTTYWILVGGYNGESGNLQILATLIPAMPRLSATLQANSIVLSWPTNAVGFVLESTTNLGPVAFWTAVTSTPDVTGSNYVVTIKTTAAPSKFFRLRSQ